jgi:hypothetical protein
MKHPPSWEAEKRRIDAEVKLLLAVSVEQGEKRRITGKRLSEEDINELIKNHRMDMSVRTVQRKLKRIRDGGGTFRKGRSGKLRWHESYKRGKIAEAIIQYGDMRGWRFTYREMETYIMAKNGIGSLSTIWRVAWNLGIRSRKAIIRPVLSPLHKLNRKTWVVKRIAEWKREESGSGILVVYIDESWIKEGVDATYKLLPGRPPVITHLINKRQMVKAMFLGAVSRPLPEIGHDGFFDLFLVAKEEMTGEGETTQVVTTMTEEVFVEMIKNKLVPCITERLHGLDIHVIIQMDRAGGHGGGRADIEEGTIRELNEWATRKKLNIEFRAQPARSPDLNMCDLGFWHSLQTLVAKLRLECASSETRTSFKDRFDKAIPGALQEWRRTKAMDVLAGVHRELRRKLDQILALDGDNNYAR